MRQIASRQSITLSLAAFILLGCLSSPAQASGCAPLALEVTTSPTPPQTYPMMLLHDQQASAAAQKSIAMVIIGDSLIFQWPNDLLIGAAHKRVVAKFGVPGDRTQNTLWRISQLKLKWEDTREIVLLTGTNNLGSQDPVCAIAAAISAAISALKASAPHARLTIIGVPFRYPAFDGMEERRLALNKELARIALGNFIDSDAIVSCSSRPPCAYLQKDGLHFLPETYKAFSEALRFHTRPLN